MRLRATHAMEAGDVARMLGTDPVCGLDGDEAAERLRLHGPNRPRQARRPPYARLLAHELIDPLVLLLIGASVVSIAIGDVGEGIAIVAVVFVNGALGFSQEAAAERAILALSESFAHVAVVVRGGVTREVAVDEVVPGDLLVVSAGDRIAADGRVESAYALEVDESALTGESLPVTKRPDAVVVPTPLAERTSMVYAGSATTRGRGRVIVTATGAGTEVGQIERLTASARPPQTPLARRLARLAQQMVVVGVALTVVLAAAMLLRGEPLEEAFLVGVAVAVAAVPEGLAAIVTAALALGARAMAGRGAIVRRLEAIETLGETTVICTDKTGTLTENRVRVAALRPADRVDERELLRAAVLASSLEDGAHGDPIDQALLTAAIERGFTRGDVIGPRQVLRELPFDSDRKRMTVVYDEGGSARAYTKGAPEVLASRSRPDEALAETARLWAAEGFRVLAVSSREVGATDGDVEDGHELLGLVALHDPLRATTVAAVEAARDAGIDIRMLTGDHPSTARTIGRGLGLADAAIVARATPAQKLALVERLQSEHAVVAVTGDGVNDAPALRRADVGVAMGRSGTEAAREAAAIVLTDDDFATIVAAVEEGRRIGDNIRTFVAFLLSANFGEVVVFAVAIVAGLGVPLAVIQILLVNLITDGLPALSLVRDPPSPQTMASPPRPGAQLFSGAAWLALASVGLLVGVATLAAFGAGRAFGGGVAQTMAFATLALSELCVVFALRTPRLPAWRAGRNTWLVASSVLSAAVVASVVYVAPFHDVFASVALGPAEAATVALLAVAPMLVVEAGKAVARR